MDVSLELSEDGADFALEQGDLKADGGLVTAVLLSLFSDARADPDDELPGDDDDPRGWWGSREGDEWGSRIWLLARSKRTAETAERMRRAAEEALVWLVEDGIASRVAVTAELRDPDRIDLTIELVRSPSRLWDELWAATRDASFERPPVLVQLLAR